jgi:hypothetical protein
LNCRAVRRAGTISCVGRKHHHYRADSAGDANLAYQAGGRYQFSFDLDDADLAGDVAGGNLVGVMTAPDIAPVATIDQAPAFAGDTARIAWTPAAKFGLVRIRDADGAMVYQNFDFLAPQFDGSKWARLHGSPQDLGVDVFADAGNYTVEVCVVDRASDFDTALSAELGALSGFLMGRCAAPEPLTVAP